MPLSIKHKKILIGVSILLGCVVLVSLYYIYNPQGNLYFIPCPFHYTTGLHCPGCGSQRAIHQLLHLNIWDAFLLNPLLVLSIPLVGIALVIKIWNYYFNTSYTFLILNNRYFVKGYLITVVVFWVLRNIPIYPFNVLAP